MKLLWIVKLNMSGRFDPKEKLNDYGVLREV